MEKSKLTPHSSHFDSYLRMQAVREELDRLRDRLIFYRPFETFERKPKRRRKTPNMRLINQDTESKGYELNLPTSVITLAQKITNYLSPHIREVKEFNLAGASCLYAASLLTVEELSDPKNLKKLQVNKSVIEDRYSLDIADLLMAYQLDAGDDLATVLGNAHAIKTIYQDNKKPMPGVV